MYYNLYEFKNYTVFNYLYIIIIIFNIKNIIYKLYYTIKVPQDLIHR